MTISYDKNCKLLNVRATRRLLPIKLVDLKKEYKINIKQIYSDIQTQQKHKSVMSI